MTEQITRKRLATGAGMVLGLALTVIIVAAAMNARAANHDQDLKIIGPSDSEIFAAGNSFPDDVRAEYRLKFGEPDDTRPGAASEAPPHQAGGRETFERLVNDGSHVYIGTLTFAPEENGQTGGVDWHTHPGPFTVAVVEGALTVTWASDCEPRTYEAGEAFIDLGEDIHKAKNLSGEETVVYFSVIGVPDGEPITTVHAGEEGFEEPC
jgi:quercetin dioxygenase-like cupin family protein